MISKQELRRMTKRDKIRALFIQNEIQKLKNKMNRLNNELNKLI